MSKRPWKNVIKEGFFKAVFGTAAVFSILAVVLIIVFLIYRGSPALQKIGFFDFVFNAEWMSDSRDTYASEVSGSYGILTMIAGSLYAAAGTVTVGGTLGFFTAVFLAKFCPKRIKKPLNQIINLLAGIPSVIYGFFGMRVVVPLLGVFSANGDGSGILAVGIVLGIMITPTVAALSGASIEAVDASYYEGAAALGASREQAVFKTVVPAAKSGIFASVVLGVGRAIGETMAVVMLAGNNAVFPSGLFSSFRTMTANIVLEMSYAGELQAGALAATGLVLTFFILVINLCFNALKGGKMAKKRTAAGRKANPFGRYFNRACQKTRFSASPLYGQNPPKEENYVNNKPAKHSNAAAIAAVGKYVSYAAAAAAVFALLAVVLFVLINGLPHVTGELLFGAFNYGGAPSIAASLLATAMLIFLTSLIAFPIGVFTAIFLAEYTVKGGKFVRLIRLTVETLGGIPSIVYGLFGMIFFCGILNMGTSIIAGCLTVSLMIIPTTVRGTEEALLAVPDSLREGSYALGGGRLTTVRRVVLPPALPGILAAVILGIGRMAAESAPVLFTMGASLKPTPTGYRSSGTTLAVALYALAREGAYVDEAYATACVLVVGVLTLNIISAALGARLQKKLSGGGGIKAQSK